MTTRSDSSERKTDSERDENKPTCHDWATHPATKKVDTTNDQSVSTTAHDVEYPARLKVATILVAFMTSNLLVALDTTITATAIPVISTHFKTLQDVGWYVSAYLLTNCLSQLLCCKLYSLFAVKPTFLCALVIFEVGSLICALSRNSATFVAGRAIAGAGSAGILFGSLIAIAKFCRPEGRAKCSASIVSMYGIGSVAGPLIGGALVTKVSWRWIFYLNLPLGGLAIFALLILFWPPACNAKNDNYTRMNDWTSDWKRRTWKNIARFDPFGNIFFLASIICLLFALQLGGTTFPFQSGTVVLLFAFFSLFLVVWATLQFTLPEATVPSRLLKQRTIVFAALYQFCTGASFFVFVYFLPIWFQGVHENTALDSGLHILPLVLAQTISIVASSITASVSGRYTVLMWISTVLASVGAGLLTTLNQSSSTAKWIGYQVLYGFGNGLGYQQSMRAAQTVCCKDDKMFATVLMVFIEYLGGTVFVSVGSNVFTTRLIGDLKRSVPSLDTKSILAAGPTGLKRIVPTSQYASALAAYNDAVIQVFRIGLGLTCLTAVGVASVEWRRASSDDKSDQTEDSTELGQLERADPSEKKDKKLIS